MKQARSTRTRPERTHKNTHDKDTQLAERLAAFIDLSSDAIFARGPDGTITFWSRGAETLYGWSRTEAVGRRTDELLHVEYPEPLECILATLQREGRWQGELVHTRRDGTRVAILSRWQLRRGASGRPDLIAETNTDITHQKETEKSLAETQSRLQTALEAITEGYYVLDGEWRFVQVNPVTERHFGHLAPELLGQNIWELTKTPPESPIYQQFHRAAAEGQPLSFETESGVRPGYWSELHLYPRHGFLEVYYRDIADRKRAEVALRESEQKYSLIFDQSSNPIALLKLPEVVIVDANEALEKLIGYTREEMIGRTAPELGIASVEVRDQALAQLGEQGPLSEREMRIVTRSGQERILVVNTNPLQLSGQQYALTTMRDITGRKQAEVALEESKEQLRVAAMAAEIGMWHWTPGTNHVEVTANWRHLFGVSEDAIVTFETWREAVHPDDREEAVRELNAAADEHRDFNRQYRMVQPDGGIRWISDRGRATYDADGRPIHMAGVNVDITLLHEAQQALRASNEKFTKAFAKNPSAMVLTRLADGTILDVNETWVEMLGHRREDAIGRTSLSLNIWPRTEDRTDWMRQLKERRSYVNQELTLLRRSGEPFVSLGSAEVLRIGGEDVVLTSLLDITDRKRAEQVLEQERNLLRTLADHLPDMIYVKDTAGRFLIANAATARVMGVTTPQALLGKADRDFYPPNLAAEYAADEEQILNTGEALKDKVEPKFDPTGTRRDILTTKVPLRDGQGLVVGLVGISRDITELKRAEAEREELLAREQIARVQAEAAVKIRDQFISVASHELKTPLTTIRGYAELVVQRGAQMGCDESILRMLQTISTQSGRMEKMIYALLDISRIERGQLALELAPVNLCALLECIVDDVRPTLRKHTLEFGCSGRDLVMQGDESRLEQVLQNLIQNAVKYSPLGGPIRVEVCKDNRNAQITITDEGIGIPSADLPQLFTRFHRAQNAEAFHINGLGVGLYVVREIVRLHGGEITVESEEGKGSTFRVTLPLDLKQEEPQYG